MTETQLLLLDKLGTTTFSILYIGSLLFVAICCAIIAYLVCKLIDSLINAKHFSKKELAFILNNMDRDISKIETEIDYYHYRYNDDTLINDDEYFSLCNLLKKYNNLREKIVKILGVDNGNEY